MEKGVISLNDILAVVGEEMSEQYEGLTFRKAKSFVWKIFETVALLKTRSSGSIVAYDPKVPEGVAANPELNKDEDLDRASLLRGLVNRTHLPDWLCEHGLATLEIEIKKAADDIGNVALVGCGSVSGVCIVRTDRWHFFVKRPSTS